MRRRNADQRLALFFDNLSCHRSADVRATEYELDIRLIFNAIYSPELNPIELVFAMIKNFSSKEKLKCIRNDKQFIIKKETEQALRACKITVIQNCIKHDMVFFRLSFYFNTLKKNHL